MKNRLAVADLLKGFTCLMFVTVHVLSLFCKSGVSGTVPGKIILFFGGAPAAPALMLLMGFFLGRSQKGLFHWIRRGLFLLFMGLLLNLMLNMNLLLHLAAGSFPTISPLQLIFGVDIFFLAGLSIITLSLASVILYRRAYIFFGLALLVFLLRPFVDGVTLNFTLFPFFHAFFGGGYSWSYFPLFPWLAYPATGYAVALVFESMEQREHGSSPSIESDNYIATTVYGKLPLYSSLIALPFFGYYFQSGFTTSTLLPEYYHHGFLYFLWALCLNVLWLNILWLFQSLAKDHYTLRLLRWLGRNMTQFYIFQWILIGNCATFFYKTQTQWMLIPWILIFLFITMSLVKGISSLSIRIEWRGNLLFYKPDESEVAPDDECRQMVKRVS